MNHESDRHFRRVFEGRQNHAGREPAACAGRRGGGEDRPRPTQARHSESLLRIRDAVSDHPGEPSGAPWLIVESNSILHEIEPDLVIYLEGENPKASAQYAQGRADIVSGRSMDNDTVAALAARLGISTELVRKIAYEAGAECESP